MFYNYFLYRAVYGIMKKNMVEPCRAQMAVRSLRLACWMSEVTDPYSENEIRGLEL